MRCPRRFAIETRTSKPPGAGRAVALGLCLTAAMALGAANAAQAASVVAPNDLASVDGDWSESIPFNLGALGGISESRYQQVYDASAFLTAFGSGPKSITGIKFRPDAAAGYAFGSTTLTEVLIRLSTTDKNSDGLSTTFADNVGLDETTVIDGSITLESSDTDADGLLGGPRAFDIAISFTTPFIYDPTVGNLLLDIINSNNVRTTYFDSENTLDDSIASVYSEDVESSTGGRGGGKPGSSGLVTQFEFSEISPVVIPLPAASWVGLIGFGLLAAASRFRRGRDAEVAA